MLTALIKNAFCLLTLLIETPFKLIGWLIVKLLELIGAILPATPNGLKIGNILTGIVSQSPFAGGIIMELIGDIAVILAIVILVKIWKIFVPFF